MDYQGLVVWQQAMELCDEVYRLTRAFPKCEMFGLSSQMRKAATSGPSNIAEGEGRLTRGERRQFLAQARGSLYEVETQLRIAQRAGYSVGPEAVKLVSEVKRPLDGYIAFGKKQ